MILPEHCKFVGVTEYMGEFSENALEKIINNVRVYGISKYIILSPDAKNLKNNSKAGIIQIYTSGDSMMRHISGFKIITLPEETQVVVDIDIDVMNPPELIPFAIRQSKVSGKRGIVVKGKDNHVNFVCFDTYPEILTLKVIDVFPDGKLARMVKELVSSGLIDSSEPVEIKNEKIDLLKLAGKASKTDVDAIIFPCRMDIPTELHGKAVGFADRPITHSRIALIGCDISRMVVEETFDGKVIHFNICPRQKAPNGELFITRCCKKENTGKWKNGYVVHWGASYRDVLMALNVILTNKNNR